jgi:hypothetical protein
LDEIPILIPSRERHEIGMTWKLFNKKFNIQLFVNKEEKSSYLPHQQNGLIKKIHTHELSFSPAIRNRMLDWSEKEYGAGAWVFMMDDDINRVGKFLSDGKGKTKAPTLDPSIFMQEFYENVILADKKGYHFIGVSPTTNRIFYNPNRRFKTNVFINGPMMAIKLSKLRFDLNCITKCDYDFSCQHIDRKMGVLRIDYLWQNNDYHALPGGVSKYRTLEKEKRTFNYLLEKWPRMLRENPKKKEGRPYEIILSLR